jgi:hypothetical protein
VPEPLGCWSDVDVEAPDDELDAICEGVEFPQVEVLPGALEKYADGGLLLYVEFRAHSDLWRVRENPDKGKLEGWLDGALVLFNGLTSDIGSARIPPPDIGRSRVHCVSGHNDQTMLVLVRQVPQAGKGRWVVSTAQFFRVGLMERKLFGSVLSNVLENRRVGKPPRFVADGESDLSRLLIGWFARLVLPGQLPRDVVERSPESVDALAQSESEIDGWEFSEEKARDVASLLRVVVNDNAILFGVVKSALDLLEIGQTFATTLQLASSVD